jgi:hypothetical protein
MQDPDFMQLFHGGARVSSLFRPFLPGVPVLSGLIEPPEVGEPG